MEGPGREPPPPPRRQDPDPDEPDGPSPFGLLPLVIILVLVAVGFFVAFQMKDVSDVQNCVMSGRKNCAPIDTTTIK